MVNRVSHILAMTGASVLLSASMLFAQPDARFSPFLYEGVAPDAPMNSRTQYRNPILPGFYPDPSICRVGEDYYMVTSTFCYFPGIPVWHSTDLIHWEQCGNALSNPKSADFGSMPMAMGVFAPQISYNPGNGLFYIVNTIMLTTNNFFITSEDPRSGVWSDPIPLPSIPGIDPSLFFDSDGRAWIVSSAGPSIVHKPLDYPGECAIILQEFDWKARKTKGKRKMLVRAGVHPEQHPTALEGPHLYHIGDKYFLMCAEGGTEPGHSEVIFVSDSVDGPYTACPVNPILTQRDLPLDRLYPAPDGSVPLYDSALTSLYVPSLETSGHSAPDYINPLPVTCTGHADLVQSPAGQWYAVFLGCQPYEGDYFFNTGRQTFLLPVSWTEGQPVILPAGSEVPLVADKTADMETMPNRVAAFDFHHPGPLWDKNGLKDFALLQRAPSETFWKVDKYDVLSLQPLSVSLEEYASSSMIVQRITSMLFSAETTLDFSPHGEHEAGIVFFQNNMNYIKFVKRLNEDGNTVLRLYALRGGVDPKYSGGRNPAPKMEFLQEIPLTGKAATRPLTLRVEAVSPTEYVFSYSVAKSLRRSGKRFIRVGKPVDGRIISSYYAMGFLGATVGVYAY